MRKGACHCGAVRFTLSGEPKHRALCHCSDCRASSGAPAVAWIAFAEDQLRVEAGDLASYVGKTGSERQFCPTCGTGLFFRNESFLPGIVDVQTATLDSVEQDAPMAHIQCAERLGWMTSLDSLPEFDRFPG